MSAALTCFNEQPSDAFDWQKVKWRSPEMGRPQLCCYCNGVMRSEEASIIAKLDIRHSAVFCEQCLNRFWAKRP